MNYLTIGDASRALGIPMPGLVWHEGTMGGGLQRVLDKFVVDHEGHLLRAHRGDPSHMPLQVLSLFCDECGAKLDEAVAESAPRPVEAP